MSRIDPDAFTVLMRNLIENALLHGDAGEAVIIMVKEAGTVSVVNGGPAVPAHKLETLKARFVRGRTHARGSGLGLAIAETTAAGAGASLELISPATGRTTGFEAVLHLSAVQAA
jgi:two-component system OmpR family sensor kinase